MTNGQNRHLSGQDHYRVIGSAEFNSLKREISDHDRHRMIFGYRKDWLYVADSRLARGSDHLVTL